MQSKLYIPAKDQVAEKLIKQYLVNRYPQESAIVSSVLRYEHFSKMQGHCLESVFNGDDNLLVNAPTGSGKTHVFELAILQSYLQCPAKATFKAVLVAPIKSLCAEISASWQQVFGGQLKISE